MINVYILILGTSSFAMALIIHILVWRRLRPVRQLILLGIIFILLPSVTYLIAFCRSPYSFDILFSALWHLSLSSAYIASYPLFQAKCPSLKIMLAVSSSMPEGMTAESICNLFSQDILLNDRIKDLINDGLIIPKAGDYVLSLKGLLLVIFFSKYRRLLGMPQGEG